MKIPTENKKYTNLNRRQFIGTSGAAAAGLGILTIGAQSINTFAQPPGAPRPGEGAPPPGMNAPTYSLAERDRRFDAVRALLDSNNLDAVLVPQRTGETIVEFAKYLTNVNAFLKPAVVVLPVDGEPFTVNGAPFPGPRWIEQDYLDMDGYTGELLLRAIREQGLDGKRFGVIGLGPGRFGVPEFFQDGLWDHSVWNKVESGLPDATFVDVTDQFAAMMMVKGDEEIANLRRAAEAGERLHEFMLATAREGMDFRELRAEIHKFFTLNDIDSDIQVHMGGGPLQTGQSFATEYGIHYSGGYAQVTLTFAIGEPSDAVLANAEVVRQVLEYGMNNVRPGRTFASVIDPMEQIIADAGRQHGFPNIHSVMPLALVGPVGGRGSSYTETRGGDIVLQPGMALSFECGARSSPFDEVRLGGTGVVTEDGFEMYNSLGLELHSV